MLLKLKGFKYATSLDLNMGYYHIKLSLNSKRLCTIVLPWGKYKYQGDAEFIIYWPNMTEEASRVPKLKV